MQRSQARHLINSLDVDFLRDGVRSCTLPDVARVVGERAGSVKAERAEAARPAPAFGRVARAGVPVAGGPAQKGRPAGEFVLGRRLAVAVALELECESLTCEAVLSGRQIGIAAAAAIQRECDIRARLLFNYRPANRI